VLQNLGKTSAKRAGRKLIFSPLDALLASSLILSDCRTVQHFSDRKKRKVFFVENSLVANHKILCLPEIAVFTAAALIFPSIFDLLLPSSQPLFRVNKKGRYILRCNARF
jgi:hypothetical protein